MERGRLDGMDFVLYNVTKGSTELSSPSSLISSVRDVKFEMSDPMRRIFLQYLDRNYARTTFVNCTAQMHVSRSTFLSLRVFALLLIDVLMPTRSLSMSIGRRKEDSHTVKDSQKCSSDHEYHGRQSPMIPLSSSRHVVTDSSIRDSDTARS